MEGREVIKGKKKTLGNARFPRACGGRNRTRTCDPIDVNDVLYPCVRFSPTIGTADHIYGRMAQLVEPTGQVIKLPGHEYLK